MRIIWMISAIGFSFFSGGLSAQEMDPEQVIEILNEQAEDISELCDSVYGKDIRLVNGRVYFPPYPHTDGHPFFKDPDGMMGSVTVRGATFTRIKLKYDIFQDHLVLIDGPAGGLMILLNKNHTETFTLEEHKFILLDSSTGINIPEKQYFEVLYSGKVSLVQRHTKIIGPLVTQEYPFGRYSNPVITRYIMKDGLLYRFTNRFSLYIILADRKSEVKKYRKKNRITNVRKASDQKIAGLIEYYNSIIP